MSSSWGNGSLYAVHCSGALARELRKIQRRAFWEGRGDETAAAFRQIIQRLLQDPAGVGEPLYQLPALRLQVRCVVVRPLAIDFTIYEDRRLVFLKAVKLLS
jgi:hypothetical protein